MTSDCEPAFAEISQTPITPISTQRSKARRLSNFHVIQHQNSSSPTRQSNQSIQRKTPSRPSITTTNRRSKPGRPSTVPHNVHDAITPRATRIQDEPLSQAEIAQIYSSTIKLCQDNKINLRNTWTLNLIDYMPMLVRAHEDDVARTVSFSDAPQQQYSHHSSSSADTDFQLAGVTLDAGVRIYCSRVDSVHSNAVKILGGLSHTNPNADTSVDDENFDGGDNDESAESGASRSRTSSRPGRATLETNMKNITAQKLETDFAVDPLFQRTSAAFDKGGALGMLMNNLPIDPCGQIIFDSAESASVLIPEQAKANTSSEDTSESPVLIDVSDLLPPTIQNRSDKISPNFIRFHRDWFLQRGNSQFSTQSSTDEPSSTKNTSQNLIGSAMSFLPGQESSEIPIEFDYDDNDLNEPSMSGMFPESDPSQLDISGISEGNEPYDDDNVDLFTGPLTQASNDKNNLKAKFRQSVDLVEAGMALRDADEYTFFSRTALSTWAGPSHWRIGAIAGSTTTSRRDGKKPRRPRGKTAKLLDFSAEADSIDFEKEFAQGKTASAYQLSAAVRAGLIEKKVTLPEDLHLSPRMLTKLFLKRDTFVQRRGAGVTAEIVNMEEVDADEWDNIDNQEDDGNIVDNTVMDAGDHDTTDDATMDARDEVLGLDLIPEPKGVEAIDINYQKVAKKVDVRSLKLGLWAQLCNDSEVSGNIFGQSTGPSVESEQREMKDVRRGAKQTMQEVVKDLNQFMPASSLVDVTLPYVFICLLHLANEKGLVLESLEHMDASHDLSISCEEN